MILRHRSLAAALVVCLAAFFAGPPAMAGIVSVDTTQSRIAISATAPSTITVTWLVVRNPGTVNPNPGTVSSPNGRLLVNGATVGTISRILSRSVPGLTPANESLVFTETITIPRAAAFRAIKSGVPVVYRRSFTDTGVPPGPASGTGSVDLNPSGPGSEPFSVSRLDLQFDDRTRVKVLPKGSRLRAIAELNTTGSGLISGQWEIAEASTTAGTPVFRPLALVRQGVAGGRRTTIVSPPLPTRFEGNTFVRLRLTDPDPFFDEPELQYYVTPKSPLPEKQEPLLMLVTAPSPGTPLTLTTRFAWQAVPGTYLYKLEFFGAPSGPAEIVANDETVSSVPLDPVPDTGSVQGRQALTGIVAPGAVTEVRLKDYSLAHLPPDRRYLWTVKAIDQDGTLLGVSPPREIYKP
ncbi:MAG: hypothetical protein RH942_19135 [Kiloniellaceae bacterium]